MTYSVFYKYSDPQIRNMANHVRSSLGLLNTDIHEEVSKMFKCQVIPKKPNGGYEFIFENEKDLNWFHLHC